MPPLLSADAACRHTRRAAFAAPAAARYAVFIVAFHAACWSYGRCFRRQAAPLLLSAVICASRRFLQAFIASRCDRYVFISAALYEIRALSRASTAEYVDICQRRIFQDTPECKIKQLHYFQLY